MEGGTEVRMEGERDRRDGMKRDMGGIERGGRKRGEKKREGRGKEIGEDRE